jgi:hypothetical protein
LLASFGNSAIAIRDVHSRFGGDAVAPDLVGNAPQKKGGPIHRREPRTDHVR